MGFLGLDALQWFVVADLFVLMGSTTLAAALYRRLRAHQETRRLLEARLAEEERAAEA